MKIKHMNLKVPELKCLCEVAGLKKTGRKGDLVQRLLNPKAGDKKKNDHSHQDIIKVKDASNEDSFDLADSSDLKDSTHTDESCWSETSKGAEIPFIIGYEEFRFTFLDDDWVLVDSVVDHSKKTEPPCVLQSTAWQCLVRLTASIKMRISMQFVVVKIEH